MGRVYEALKRASASQAGGTGKKELDETTRRSEAGSQNGARPANGHDAPKQEHPWDRSPLFASQPAAHNSASTAHTDATAGSALPGATVSRDAGATLDAAGPARAALDVVTLDISAARVEPHLIAITQPRSAYCEQFRNLRTRVLHASERRKMQAIVVTSAGVAEGKTLTALNLAWLLAQTDGVRALIIDSDLRQPCTAEYLGIDAPNGLSEMLAGDATLEESIIRLEPAGLYLMPGGAPRDDVAELLSGPKFGRILSEVRPMFDYIIIDAPPLGIFTDATVLINRADGALMVVRSGKTRYATVDHLLEHLPRERMLGVILNRAAEELDESSYYYQRRYYRRDLEDETTLPDTKTRVTEEEAEEVVS